MMKPLLIVLAVLATAKVLHHEYLFRTSTRDVIIQAYRERAVLACQKDALGTMLGVSPQAWSTPSSITLAIGKRNLDVHLWQVDHKNCGTRATAIPTCSSAPASDRMRSPASTTSSTPRPSSTARLRSATDRPSTELRAGVGARASRYPVLSLSKHARMHA